MNFHQATRFLRGRTTTILLVASFLIALLLRTVRLDQLPPIYPDEASNLEVANSLFRGDFRAGLFTSSFLPRLPLPLALINLAAVVTDWNLYAIRICTVAASLLAFVLIYKLVGWGSSQYRFLPPLILAVYLPALYFSRWGFTYNFLAPAFLYVLYKGIEYRQSRRSLDLYLMSLAIAAALLSEPLGIVALIYGVLICSFRSPGALWKLLLISLAPLCAYLALLYVLIPDVLSSDIQGMLQTRVSSPFTRMAPVSVSLRILFETFGWPCVLGLVGLAFAPRDVRGHSLLFAGIYFIVSAQVAGEDRTLVIRQYISLIPFQCMGMGCLAAWGALRAEDALDCLRKAGAAAAARHGSAADAARDRLRRLPALLVRSGLAIAILVVVRDSALTVWSGRFFTPFDAFAEPHVTSMYEAVAFLNSRCDESDWALAACLPQLPTCRSGRLGQMAVIEGWRGNPFFPREIYERRIAEAITFADVRYVVISSFTRRVEARLPGVGSLLQRTEQWPVVFEREGVIIRESDQQGDPARGRG